MTLSSSRHLLCFWRWERRQMPCCLPSFCLGQAVWLKGRGRRLGGSRRFPAEPLGAWGHGSKLHSASLSSSCCHCFVLLLALAGAENSPEAGCVGSVPDRAVVSSCKTESVLPLFLLLCIQLLSRECSLRVGWSPRCALQQLPKHLSARKSDVSSARARAALRTFGPLVRRGWCLVGIEAELAGEGNHRECCLQPGTRCVSSLGRKCAWQTTCMYYRHFRLFSKHLCLTRLACRVLLLVLQ